MADWSGIRAAIASNAMAVSGMREGTSTSLDSVGMLPAVKVTHVESVQMGDRSMSQEYRQATVKGQLLVASPAGPGRAEVAMETLAEGLAVVYRKGIQLGFPTVVKDSWLDRWESGTFTYGDTTFNGADLTWIVQIRDEITRTA